MRAEQADQTAENQQDDAARGFLFTAAVLVVTLTITISAQLPKSIVPDWLIGQRDTYKALWPQGSNFFRNSAGKEFVVAYALDDENANTRPITRPLADQDHLWGLTRDSYAELVEVTLISKAISDKSWRTCEAVVIDDCRTTIASAPRTTLDAFEDSWCGPAVITVERPSRWTGPRRITRLAVVDLTCPR